MTVKDKITQMLHRTPKEKCVMCGKATRYDYNTPVNERAFYAKGVGQLCRSCYADLYSDNK